MNLSKFKSGPMPWLLGIFIITVTVYFSSLSNGFVNYDEDVLIWHNHSVTSFTISEMFEINRNFKDYLPLTFLSFAIEYKIFGKNPLVFHLTNLFLHLLCSLLFFFFIKRLLSLDDFKSFWFTLIFAVHPIHVESVAWVAQRKDVLYASFYLAGLLFYLKYLNTPKNQKNLIWVFVLFILSLLSKLMAITLPAVLLVIDYYQGRKDHKKILLEKAPFLIPAAIVLFIHFQARHTVKIMGLDRYSFWASLYNGLTSLSFYLFKSVIPIKLSAYYPASESGVDPYMYAFSYFVIFLIVTYLFFIPQSRKKIGLGILFFLIPLAPALKVIPFGTSFMFAERFLYLPIIGVFILLYALIEPLLKLKIIKKHQAFSWTLSSILVILVGAYSLKARERSLVWKSNLSVWSDVLDQFPKSSLAISNIGTQLLRANDVDSALKHFHKALAVNKNLGPTLNNMIHAYIMKKDIKKAREVADKAVSLYPTYAPIVYGSGLVYFLEGNYKKAIEVYHQALKVDPYLRQVHFSIGEAYFRLKNLPEAEKHFRKEIERDPGSSMAHNYLGLCYFLRKDLFNAQENFSRALVLDPNNEKAKINLQRIRDISNKEIVVQPKSPSS